MNDRITQAAKFTADMDARNCVHPRCVRPRCDGLTHHALDGTKWSEDCRPETVPEPSVTIDEYGRECHPSFGMLSANRVQSTGKSLFDSDIVHREYVIVRLATATRKRDLNHDSIHAEKQVVEVAMSLAQWGAFVSSFGSGDGTPVTITRNGYEMVEEPPHEPRLAQSIREVREAGDKAAAPVAEAAQKVAELFEAKAGRREMAEAIRNLTIRLGNMPANIEFAAKSLNEHVENVVTKARADIEAMAANAAARHPELGAPVDVLALNGRNEP